MIAQNWNRLQAGFNVLGSYHFAARYVDKKSFNTCLAIKRVYSKRFVHYLKKNILKQIDRERELQEKNQLAFSVKGI